MWGIEKSRAPAKAAKVAKAPKSPTSLPLDNSCNDFLIQHGKRKTFFVGTPSICLFFHSGIASNPISIWIVYRKSWVFKTSCAPIPQGATRIFRLQRHGLKNHGLRSGTSFSPREMPSRRSSQAWPSPSPPGRTSFSSQPWLLPSDESGFGTALEGWTCQTSSLPLRQSLDSFEVAGT